MARITLTTKDTTKKLILDYLEANASDTLVEKINASDKTMEFDPKHWEILQCYAKHNSRPDEEVLQFAQAWLKEVKRHEMSRLREGATVRTA